MLKCQTCRSEKSEDEFTKGNKILKNCFQCREKKKEWKLKNKEKVKVYNEYYNSKKEKLIKPILIRKKNTEDEYLKFNSLKECVDELELQKPNLHKVLNGQLKSTSGYEAKYGEEEIIKSIDKEWIDKEWKDVKKDKGIEYGKIESIKRVKHFEKDGIMGKTCSKCSEWVALDNYSKLKSHWDGLRNDCKSCNKKYRDSKKKEMKEYNKKYWLKTKDIQREKHKIWVKNNREIVNEYQKKYMMKWDKEQRLNNPQYKIIKNLRCRLYSALKGKSKNKYTKELIGCEVDFLIKYLEEKFDENMNWDNYGNYWHVDHIIPCTAWNLENDMELRACSNYLNLQPLEASANESKNNKYTEENKENYIKLFMEKNFNI